MKYFFSLLQALWEVTFRHKSHISALLSFFISAGLLTFLITRMDFSKAAQLLRQAQWRWLLLAACLAALIPFTGTCRWLGILRAHGNFNLPITQAWRAVMCSFVFNVFLPSKAGDFSKAVYVRNYGNGGISLGVGSVILERLVDLWMLGLFGVAGGIISSTPWGIFVGVLLMIGSTTVFVVISLCKKLPLPDSWQTRLAEWSHLFLKWARDLGAISMTLFGSFATWCLAGLIVCSLVTSLRSGTQWAYVLAIFPLAILAGLIPVTISGIGTRDSAFVIMLTGRLSTEGATLVSLGYTFLAYWLVGLLGMPILLREIGVFLKNRPLTNGAKD
jgi:glycosyltransferase 2 family protein